jgi:hypothetical protein
MLRLIKHLDMCHGKILELVALALSGWVARQGLHKAPKRCGANAPNDGNTQARLLLFGHWCNWWSD